jgi:hypothetical protein
MRSDKSPSPKTLAGSLGSAIAILFWTIASATFFRGQFDETAIIALTGATSTLAAFALSYLIPDPARSA